MVISSLARRRIKAFHMAPLVLAGTMCLLSACGSSTVADPSASDLGRKIKLPPGQSGGSTTPTPTPTPAPATGTATYDTSIGAGVDANGFADLPLRAGAHRYFVNSAQGADGNGCSAAQQPAMPLKTIAAAVACVADHAGDQVLVAEGTTYPEALPTMWGKTGYSLMYPAVLQSYDPTDPLNEAKYGRATGAMRPVLTGDTSKSPFLMGAISQGFIALRGFDINPGNLTRQGIAMVDVGDGILFENNIFRYAGITIVINTSPAAHHWILRNNSIYGNWDADPGYHTQGLYVSGTDTLTVEDNVFYHNGWKIGGAGRDSTTDGATVFRHAIYQQVNTNSVVRRNLFADGSADCGSHRGDATISENVYIDCPIAISAGGGINYNVERPSGDTLIVRDNAIFGTANLNSTSVRGWGIDTANGNQASEAFHNLLARGGVNHAFSISAGYDLPSYMNFHDNVAYLWAPQGKSTLACCEFLSQLHPSYNSNIWDDPASGTNTNISTHTFPNPYTAVELYAALGFADKQAFMNYAIEHPEAHIQRNARALLFAGYGL
jgi:hypothetical protein